MHSCLFTWIVGLGLIGTAEAGPLARYEFVQIHMGVPFEIVLYAPNEAAANTAADAAYARIEELDDLLSDYDPDSELSRLSRSSEHGRPVEVSEELLFVLSRAVELSKRSNGAFDVTVGPVVKLWRTARRTKRMPMETDLKEALQRVGWRHVQIDRDAGTVALIKPGMQLDLGGIAVGYAADEALRVLKEHGITRALVDGSGDISVSDPPPGRDGWRIGIAALTEPDARPTRFVQLKNAAISTSGDAFQHVEIDGVRYSHIVDPKTGLGLTTRSSVTVIAADGLTADSLASAVSVLGPERGLELIEKTPGAAALFVQLKDGKPQVLESQRLSKFEIERGN
ncbi:MAG: FAD:protein FMN transferase [Planctomycetaceae bacterium]